MKCDDLQQDLAEYLGSELNAAKREALDKHIMTCDSCRREVESLSETLRVLKQLPDIPEQAVPGRIQPLLGTSHQRTRPAVIWMGLRYAAVLAIGIAIGWSTARDEISTLPETAARTAGLAAVPEHIHPDWVSAAVREARSHPQRSAFMRHLAIAQSLNR